MLPVVVIWLLAIALIWIAARETHRNRMGAALMRHFAGREDVIFSAYSVRSNLRVLEINGRRGRRRVFALVITRDQVLFYDLQRELEPHVSFAPEQLRWFGRPRIYTYGANEMWFHVEIDQRWVLIRFWLWIGQMQELVRALKIIATPDQVTAYRRHRPYIHYGPITARPATQDMQGAWTLDSPLDLYIMPLYLVALRGPQVEYTLPLNTIQQVVAVRRIDRPRAAGLVRFEALREVENQPFAFAIDDHEAFADALATAAKRTLEDPLEHLRKKKKPDEFDDDDPDTLGEDTYLDEDDDAWESPRITGRSDT